MEHAALDAIAGPDEAPILKAEIIVAGRADDGSRQKDPEEKIGSEDIIAPPLPPHLLAKWSSINSTRGALVDAIALNTVGLGFTIERDPDAPRDDEAEDGTKLAADAAAIRTKLNALSARDVRLSSPTFVEQAKAVKKDEEETGSGYFEVSRNKLTGEIDGLYHAPARRMRRKKDRSGWVMFANAESGAMADSEDVHFYNFGDKVEPDQDGKATLTLKTGREWTTNEILDFRLYTSESRDYGLPRDASMAIEYLADKSAAESNASFFDSSGTPPSIIFVQGEESRAGERVVFNVPPETVKAISETIKSDGGHQKRVAIVPVPPGTNVDHVKLGEIPSRDLGYVEFRKAIARRTHATFRVALIFTSDVDGSGRYSAEVQRALTLEQVFDPEQKRWEDRLRSTLLTDLGYAKRVLKFTRLAVESDQAKREAAEQLAVQGAITNREYRMAHGYGPLPEVVIGDELLDGRSVTDKRPEPVLPPALHPAGPPAPAPAPAPAKPPIVKADPPSPAPAPGSGDTTQPPEPPADPNSATEVYILKVTDEEAALIGKVKAGWNDALVTPKPMTSNQPFGGASDGSQFPHPDQRGQAPGVGGRSQQSAGGIAKGHGVDYVEEQVDALRSEFEDLSNDAIDRGLARTFALARGIVAAVETDDGRKLGLVSEG